MIDFLLSVTFLHCSILRAPYTVRCYEHMYFLPEHVVHHSATRCAVAAEMPRILGLTWTWGRGGHDSWGQNGDSR